MARIGTSIKNETIKGQFSTINVGSVFIYEHKPYIKCNEVKSGGNGYIYNAMNLESGLHTNFEPTELVTYVTYADLTLTI